MYSPSKVGEKKKKDKTETRHGLGKGDILCPAPQDHTTLHPENKIRRIRWQGRIEDEALL